MNKLKYDVQALRESDLEDDNTQLEEMFQEVITASDIDKHGYALSDLRNLINEKLEKRGTGKI